MPDMRLALTDQAISKLPLAPKGGQYRARDTELAGFMVLVGTRSKAFAIQAEFWREGVRELQVRMKLGEVGQISTRDARKKAKEALGCVARGERPGEPAKPVKIEQITLRQAWERYRDAHMRRKERSEATIRSYQDHVERLMRDWLDLPLKTLGDNPRLVADRHDQLTTKRGPSVGNGCMRTLRAIYNHARKAARELPPDNPTMAVDWNVEKRRDTALGAEDLPQWFLEAGRLRHPIRREFQLFMLLSGSRPGALMQARIEDLDVRRRILHIPRPKGGAKRAFDIPLSRPMILCLVRAMRASRMMHPKQAETWIFAAASEPGHLIEHKEARSKLSKWGNDLRQSYRTLGQAVELSDIDMHLLMNHSLPGVNAGYITRAKLLSSHLRSAQDKLSDFIIETGTASKPADGPRERAWPLLPSRRLGDARLDPTPPDPRIGRPRKRVQAKPGNSEAQASA